MTILVNATSVGLASNVEARLDLDPDTIREDLVVCDTIPNPPETALLRDARARGARTLDGRGMLVNQAAINVRFWTGIEVDPAVMRARLDEVIGALVGGAFALVIDVASRVTSDVIAMTCSA